MAAANLAAPGSDDRVEIIVGAALDTLPTLTGRFDFVFIDADKENNSAYVQWAIELGRPGTVIVVDNIVRDGRILDPAADDHQAQAVRDMLEMMGRHPKLDTAAIQTVGVKGWDGFALALVVDRRECTCCTLFRDFRAITTLSPLCSASTPPGGWPEPRSRRRAHRPPAR